MTIEPIARDVLGLINQHLNDAQKRFARLLDHEDAEQMAWATETDASRLRKMCENLDTAVMVQEFGTAYLLALLNRVDPTSGKAAAEWLAAQWDAGDTIGEWLWQWRGELAETRPMTLPGATDREGALDLEFGGK